MIRKIRSPIPQHVRVLFELPASVEADHIALVGDFNQWSTTATPMHREPHGVWQAVLDLPDGSRCEFRYLVDGQWQSDYHADGLTPNPYGSDNSVVIADLPEAILLMERTASQLWEAPSANADRPTSYAG